MDFLTAIETHAKFVGTAVMLTGLVLFVLNKAGFVRFFWSKEARKNGNGHVAAKELVDILKMLDEIHSSVKVLGANAEAARAIVSKTDNDGTYLVYHPRSLVPVLEALRKTLEDLRVDIAKSK